MRDDFDILACLGNISSEEVFTPTPLAKAMLDILPKDIWTNPNVRILDPVCKSGIFLLEAAKRLDKGLKTVIPNMQERINHIFEKQIFGIPVTKLTSSISRRTLYGSKTANDKYSIAKCFSNGMGNIPDACSKHEWIGGRCAKCGAPQSLYGSLGRDSYAYPLLHAGIEEIFGMPMEFDVVIGNPPYQMATAGADNGAQAKPLYHLFVERAKELNPEYIVMITPSRWFSGGWGLDEFRNAMIDDERIEELHDFPDASDCFPDVEIKGGVSYFLWNRRHRGTCRFVTHSGGNVVSDLSRKLKEDGCDILIRYNEAIGILRKIQAKKETSFDTIVSSQRPFDFPTNFAGAKSKPFPNAVKLYANRKIGYINESLVRKNRHVLHKYKLIVPKAVGSGDPKTDVIKPLLCEPGACCTETYLFIGPFNDQETCRNVMAYIGTRFFHFLVTLQKHTQDCLRKVYSFVPMQDFSRSWTDDDLYKKYNLADEEIAFIEKMIRPM